MWKGAVKLGWKSERKVNGTHMRLPKNEQTKWMKSKMRDMVAALVLKFLLSMKVTHAQMFSC